MTTHNHTTFDLETIASLPVVKRGKNNWRQRDMTLLSHPDDAGRLISVGITFDQSMRVISDNARSDWARELSQSGDFK
ncbi:MAG: hypothetical protein ACXAEN_23180, partial [Candidatus Thorarchaeota archaeon]